MDRSEIFAERLKRARIGKGYSMAELAAAMGGSVSKMAISKYEQNKMLPNSSVVILLSKALEKPVDYFVRPFSVSIDSIKFRKRKSVLSVKDENAIRENISDLIERYINIEEICDAGVSFVSPFQRPIICADEIKNAALELRRRWNIDLAGIVSVVELLETHGFKVLDVEATSAFDGLSSLVNNSFPVIVLNKKFDSERKRFTALHELGHLIFKFDPSVSEQDEEKLCNAFASEMLIPESVFKKIVGSRRHDMSYQEMKAIQIQYGISCDALLYKAADCGIISNERKRFYFIKKNKNNEFKKRVEESLFPPENPRRFVRLVFKALSQELISISKAAALLHSDVEQVQKDLALV